MIQRQITVNRAIEDPIALNRYSQLLKRVEKVLNATTTRRRGSLDESPDPRRDVDDECGYPKTDQLRTYDYSNMYNRNPIAKKVVELKPKHTWQVHPIIFEDENPEVETDFEREVKRLGDNLKGKSWYQDDQGDPFWEYLARVDILAGIGHYGALLLGVSGEEGKDLSQPLKFSSGKNKRKNRELIFVRVFPEWLARIGSYDTDETSPRFGLPEMYQLSFDNLEQSPISIDSSVVPSASTQPVHWTRVIHVTHQLMSNEIFAIPDMRPVFDRLMDLDKLYGGSAEMYWKGAFPGFSLETHPQLGGDVSVDASAIKSEMENLFNGLQRYMLSTGMTANSLAPQVVDPSPQINTQIEAICIEQDCPKRIFLGSERGELASSQDATKWDETIQSRRENETTPKLIVPVIDRLILLGVLPEPVGYSILWPEIETMSPLEKADIATKITQSIIAYVSGGGEQLLPVASFLTLVLGFTIEEANSILEVLTESNREIIITTEEEGEEDGGEERKEGAASKTKAEEDKGAVS